MSLDGAPMPSMRYLLCVMSLSLSETQRVIPDWRQIPGDVNWFTGDGVPKKSMVSFFQKSKTVLCWRPSLGARTLLGVPGIATRERSDATNGALGLTRSKKHGGLPPSRWPSALASRLWPWEPRDSWSYSSRAGAEQGRNEYGMRYSGSVQLFSRFNLTMASHLAMASKIDGDKPFGKSNQNV